MRTNPLLVVISAAVLLAVYILLFLTGGWVLWLPILVALGMGWYMLCSKRG